MQYKTQAKHRISEAQNSRSMYLEECFLYAFYSVLFKKVHYKCRSITLTSAGYQDATQTSSIFA